MYIYIYVYIYIYIYNIYAYKYWSQIGHHCSADVLAPVDANIDDKIIPPDVTD